MKKILLNIILLLACYVTLAQDNNEIKIKYLFGSNTQIGFNIAPTIKSTNFCNQLAFLGGGSLNVSIGPNFTTGLFYYTLLNHYYYGPICYNYYLILRKKFI